jgi:hypothetical protein
MEVKTRRSADGRRVHVSDGQGTTASFPWTPGITVEENHLSAAVDFARELKGFTPAVVSSSSPRPSADGYVVTLSRYTEEA